MNKILGALLFIALIWACSSDDSVDPVDDVPTPTQVTFERSAMLVNWADNIIVPSYVAFSAELDAMNTAFAAFKADTSESNLIAFRQSWLSAYTFWQQVSMFEIGPAETVGLRLNINIFPADTDRIDVFAASGDFDFSLSSNRDVKGFPALDYLINGLGENDTEIIAKYNSDDQESLLTYTEAVLVDMTTLANGVLSDWQQEYRDIFVASDGSSATASVDRFVNDYIFYYEKFLRAGKMGIPLGVFSGSTLPGNVEAFYAAEVSNKLFLTGLQAVQDFFNGKHFGSSTTGESLASYLDALNTLKDGEDLNAIINSQFDSARAGVTDLNSFREEIENNDPPTQMLLAYDEVQKGVPLLKVDMVSAMSISIDFVDADGD